MKRWLQIDRRLWGLVALVFASGIVVAEYVIDGDPKWTGLIEDRGAGWGYQLLKNSVHLLGKVAAGVAGAWVIHALLLRCGIRLSLRTDPQAPDYDDKPSIGPAA
jgi:hypothetical protein